MRVISRSWLEYKVCTFNFSREWETAARRWVIEAEQVNVVLMDHFDGRPSVEEGKEFNFPKQHHQRGEIVKCVFTITLRACAWLKVYFRMGCVVVELMYNKWFNLWPPKTNEDDNISNNSDCRRRQTSVIASRGVFRRRMGTANNFRNEYLPAFTFYSAMACPVGMFSLGNVGIDGFFFGSSCIMGVEVNSVAPWNSSSSSGEWNKSGDPTDWFLFYDLSWTVRRP